MLLALRNVISCFLKSQELSLVASAAEKSSVSDACLDVPKQVNTANSVLLVSCVPPSSWNINEAHRKIYSSFSCFIQNIS
jgi:hypothetical protein